MNFAIPPAAVAATTPAKQPVIRVNPKSGDITLSKTLRDFLNVDKGDLVVIGEDQGKYHIAKIELATASADEKTAALKLNTQGRLNRRTNFDKAKVDQLVMALATWKVQTEKFEITVTETSTTINSTTYFELV